MRASPSLGFDIGRQDCVPRSLAGRPGRGDNASGHDPPERSPDGLSVVPVVPAGQSRGWPGYPPLAARTVRRGRSARWRPVHELVRATVDAQCGPDRIGSLLRSRRVPAGPPEIRIMTSLAAFNAETASGEGAHGPDRSRLAKCYHCRTSRQERQPAETGVDPNTAVASPPHCPPPAGRPRRPAGRQLCKPFRRTWLAAQLPPSIPVKQVRQMKIRPVIFFLGAGYWRVIPRPGRQRSMR